jgi:hypothetical protein
MRCVVVELLYERAHEYANLANRAGPIATDLLLASERCGMQTKDLHKLGAKSSKKRKRGKYFCSEEDMQTLTFCSQNLCDALKPLCFLLHPVHPRQNYYFQMKRIPSQWYPSHFVPFRLICQPYRQSTHI